MPGKRSDESPRDFDFDAFYTKRWDELRRKLGARSNSHRVDVEGIVQETMLRLREQRGIATDSDAMAWCWTVANRIMTDQARSGYQRREQVHQDPFEADSDTQVATTPEPFADTEDLERLLAALPPRQAQALRLEVEGHSRAEIASLLNVSRGNVRQLLHRARRAARDRWTQLASTFFMFTVRTRRSQQPSVNPGQGVVASLTVASIVAVLVFPSTGSLARSARVTQAGHRAVSTLVAAARHRAKPASAHPSAAATARASYRAGKSTARPHPPVLVPRVPTTCAPHVCVGGCPSEREAGDEVYLKPAGGPCGVGVAEAVAPACEYVVSNPALGCQRDGDPHWLVPPPPPPPNSRGNPL